MSPVPGPGPAGPPRLLVPRLGLCLLALAASLLVAEGALSLVGGRSLLGPRLTIAAPGPTVRLGTDADRLAASSTVAGEFRGHVDPLVGIMLRSGEGFVTFDATSSVSPDGVRGRPVPKPAEIAQHIVILGDSVAFGYGVNDDETLAHQLEQFLAQVRGPEALPIVASTVAVPGWNHRNAVHFLIDHLQHLDPDIVVFLPVANDLTDTFGITAGGHKALSPDPAEPDPWLSVHDEALLAFIARSMASAAAQGVLSDLGPDAEGPPALLSDLSAESGHRYDAAAESIALLSRVLSRADVQLLVAFPDESVYSSTLRARLLETGSEVPSVPLFTRIPRALQLQGDPHPSALGLSAMARWIADDFWRRGWVDKGAQLPWPALLDIAEKSHAQERSPAEIRARAQEAREAARLILQPRIDLSTGQGVRQIYGGLNQDGSMSSAFAALIAPAAQVEVILEPVPELPHLYPLRVTVSLDGVVVGELTVPAAGQARDVFARPPGAAPDAPLEVRLSPELWGVALAFGRSHVASCRVVSLEATP